MLNFVCKRLGSLVLASILLMMAGAALAQTERFVSPIGNDTGPCTSTPCASISYALDQADGGDTINVANGTYTEQLIIDKDIIIKGASRRFTIVQAGVSQALSPGRVVQVPIRPAGEPDRQVEISRMTIRHGNAFGTVPLNRGGGIFVSGGSLVLDSVTLDSNRAREGGGLYCSHGQNLSLLNVRFENNSANNGLGGGIYNISCSPNLINVVFEGNSVSSSAANNGRGGAMFNVNSHLTLLRTDFIGNESEHEGGAIYNEAGSSMTLRRVLFQDNFAEFRGGAIYQDGGEVSATRSRFFGNSTGSLGGPTGGAIRANQANLDFSNVRFIGNSGGSGGAVFAIGSELNLVNGLFVNNGANFGAGLYLANSESIIHNATFSTNSANSGAAVFQSEGSLLFRNSIVWGNSGQINGVEMANSGGAGTMTIAFSLVAYGCPNNASCTELMSLDPQFVDPDEGDFQLIAASLAVNAGDPGTSTALFPTDVNDMPIDIALNDRFVNGRIDLGPFEYQSVALPDPPQLISPSNGALVFGQPITLEWDAMAQAESFELQVALQSGSFEVPLVDEVLGGISFVLPELDHDSVFMWRMRANAGDGVSPWSEVRSFRTDMGVFPGPGNVLHVNSWASGNNDGSSWEHAVNDLAWALRYAYMRRSSGIWNLNNPLQIWVAAGIHYPQYRADYILGDAIDHPDTAFVMMDHVHLFGGFAGTETDIAQRDWRNNVTILSGRNTRHHVVIAAGTAGARLDGFTVSDGHALHENHQSFINVNSRLIYRERGGGIYVIDSSPVLTNLRLVDNSAWLYGAGLYNEGGSPDISNVYVAANQVAGAGGGMAIFGDEMSMRNVLIAANQSSSGFGGGISIHAGAYVHASNVTVADNIAQLGGGIYVDSGNLRLYNGMVWGNGALLGHQAYVESDGSLTFDHVIHSNEDQALYVEGTLNSSSVSHANPQFVNPATGDFRVTFGSPAVNGGSVQLYLDFGGNPHSDLDLDGGPRVINGIIDLGPYQLPAAASDQIFQDRFQ